MPDDVLGNPDNDSFSLSSDEVFKLALLFSECPLESDEGIHCREQFSRLKEKVSSAEFKSLEPEERGRAVLKLLYQDYLKSYSFAQTKINVALQTGTYNCVSSAVLYMALAKAAGLLVVGQKTSEHAFCTVYIPNTKTGQYKTIDVETTNPYGFNPGSKEAIENESKIKGYYIVPKKYYSNRQEVSDRLFAGLIAGNLCAIYIEKSDYQKAVPLGAARYELVRTEQTKPVVQVRRDFDVLASNYVNTDIEDARVYAGYIDWFIEFINRWGNTEYLQLNMDNSFYNLMVLCFNEKESELALEAYEKTEPYISAKQKSKMKDILTDIIVTARIDGKQPEEQILEIEGLFTEGGLSPEQEKRTLVYLENAWLMILNECMYERTYGTGYQKSKEALERLPQSTKIKKMQKSFYDNCIAIIHNNFAQQANDGYYDAAQKILESGLQVFPEDKTLLNDLQTLNRMKKYLN